MTTTKVWQLHFSVDARLVVELARQAYWMENRREWAWETLKCYDGMTNVQMEHILNGTASLENHPDGKRALYKDSPDTEWQEKLAKHLAWVESRTYCFAGRRVPRALVDHYVHDIVERLREAMKLGRFNMMDPVYLLDLEQQRQEQHKEIFLAAGFSQEEIDKRGHSSQWSPEFTAFDAEFSTYLDKQTNWLTNKEEL